jgi:hypothetical protein
MPHVGMSWIDEMYGMYVYNKSFANVQTFKDYGTALTNQDSMHEKIKQQIKFREFLLPFSPDYYVCPFANQKCK